MPHVRTSAIVAWVLWFSGAACRDDPIRPADRLTVRTESAHYTYLRAEGDDVDEVTQERYHAWLVGQLGITPTAKLEYRKYRDRSHLARLTGRSTNGFAEPRTPRFHTIWPWENHESVHSLVTLYLGHPPALFNEGLAVAHQAVPAGTDFQVRWNGRDPDAIAADELRAGRLPTLNAVLESPRFFDHEEVVIYPIAGSFIRHVLAQHGWAPMKAYLAASAFHASAAETRAAFRAAYGIELDAAWMAWRASLASP